MELRRGTLPLRHMASTKSFMSDSRGFGMLFL
jgi:hypothetical protein